MTAEREQMIRKIGDLPEHSEGMFRGHHVERFINGFWVDHKGPMRLEEAVDKVLVSLITQTVISDKRIDLVAPKIGHVQLSKFSPDYDHGLYAARPWHVVTFGRNFATVEECITFIQTIVDNWGDDTDDGLGESASDRRNERLIDHGYIAYAREEDYFS